MNKNIVIMGVSGAGKTTVGQHLADELNLAFFDADHFHPEINIEKMKQGIALTDSDRLPWLKKLHNILVSHRRMGCVLACSALKKSYRNLLKQATDEPFFVFLEADFDFIMHRMKEREEHFMPPSLLKSQFKTLQIPDDAFKIDASLPVEVICKKVIDQLDNEY